MMHLKLATSTNGTVQMEIEGRLMSNRVTFAGSGWGFAALVLYSTVANSLNMTGMLLMVQIYDRVLTSHSIPTLVVLCIITASLYLAQAILRAASARITERIGHRILTANEALLTTEAAHRLLGGMRPNSAFAPLEDLYSVARAIRGGALKATLDLPWSVLFLLVLGIAASAMGIFAASVILILVTSSLAVNWLKVRSISSRDDDEIARQAWETAWRSQNGLAAAASARLADTIASIRQRNREAERKDRERDRDYRSFTSMLRNFAVSGVLAAGAWMVISGNATLGVMMASMVIVSHAFSPVETFMRERHSLREAVAAWRRLKALSFPAQNRVEYDVSKLRSSAVSVDRLITTTGAGQLRVSSDLTFALKPGTALLVSGSAGVGKTLLLRTLAGLQASAFGSVRLGDQRIADLPADLREHIVGYLPQETIFLPGTLTDAVARYDPSISLPMVIDACKRVGIHESIMRLPRAYNTLLPPHGPQLSFGFARRLGIARAICTNPFLLILDDPALGLDALATKIVTDIIALHRSAGGIAVIASYSSEFQELADHILVLEGNRMKAFGSVRDVLKGPSSSVVFQQSKRLSEHAG